MQTGTISGFPLVSCDEFPIASTEEGGSYFGRLPNNPTAIATTCVPDWQQNLQGNCHKLLGRISTNVAYPDDPTAAANWQRWGSGSGTTRNDDWISVTTGGFQRYATYLATIPQAPNIGATVSAQDAKPRKVVGIVGKADFLFFLAIRHCQDRRILDQAELYARTRPADHHDRWRRLGRTAGKQLADRRRHQQHGRDPDRLRCQPLWAVRHLHHRLQRVLLQRRL